MGDVELGGNGRINNEPDKPLRSTSGGGGSGGGSPVIREKNIVWAGVSKDEFMSIIGSSDVAMYIWNEITYELAARYSGSGELYIFLGKQTGYSETNSRSSDNLRYNGIGTGGATLSLSKDFFSSSWNHQQRVLNLVHELYHAWELLTGTMHPGRTSDGLPWAEAYAMAWQNYAARQLNLSGYTPNTYTDPYTGIKYPLPPLSEYPRRVSFPVIVPPVRLEP